MSKSEVSKKCIQTNISIQGLALQDPMVHEKAAGKLVSSAANEWALF